MSSREYGLLNNPGDCKNCRGLERKHQAQRVVKYKGIVSHNMEIEIQRSMLRLKDDCS